MSVEDKIIEAVRTLAARSGGKVDVIKKDQKLVGDLGLGSLDIAELVAVLEGDVGFDPFARGASIAGVRTVGDLVELYEKHAPSKA